VDLKEETLTWWHCRQIQSQIIC